jgi:hypothetical protein
MELVLVHRIEKLSSDPAVIGRILISRRDYVLCWRLELAKTGKVLFDVGENSISLTCRQAVPDAFQAFAFDVGHLNENRSGLLFDMNSVGLRDWDASVRGDELHGLHLGEDRMVP